MVFHNLDISLVILILHLVLHLKYSCLVTTNCLLEVTVQAFSKANLMSRGAQTLVWTLICQFLVKQPESMIQAYHYIT